MPRFPVLGNFTPYRPSSLATAEDLKPRPGRVDGASVTETRETTPVAFAPEAHLPRERRLFLDGAGVIIETTLGVRHVLPWADCRAVMVWSDRAEILLNDEVSVVIRAADWHRGYQALEAIRARAPLASLVLLPDNPEPEPDRYVLRGLATSSSAVLILLALSLALVAAIGIGVGLQNHTIPGQAIGVAFAISALYVLNALVVRLNVPRRWRGQAAVRGRTSVAIDSGVARASDRALAVAEPCLYGLGGLTLGVLAVTGVHNFILPILLVGIALAVRRERERRRRRNAVTSRAAEATEGHGESEP